MTEKPTLLDLASTVDVLDLAGSIIARPRHTQVSLAAELALALAVERFWAICLEAEILANALALPMPDGARDHAIATQAQTIRSEMAALRGDPPKELEA